MKSIHQYGIVAFLGFLQATCAFQVAPLALKVSSPPLSKIQFSLSSSMHPTKTTTTTTCRIGTFSLYASLSTEEDANKNKKNVNGFALTSKEITQQVVTEQARRNCIWLAPPFFATAAYALYDDTAKVFHQCLDWASGNQWVPADGGKYVAEITKSALSGPVTFSVSILFGTLVGLTITTLNSRQSSLQRLFVQLHQEGQELRQLLEECPYEIQEQGLVLLTRFLHRLDQTLRVPDKDTDAALRQGQELASLSRLFHQHMNKRQGDSVSINGALLGEIYSSLARIKSLRVELQTAYSHNFAPAHYASMTVLGAALLFIFLLQTDNGVTQFLIEFQLSICWALLIGAYSLLAAVIVDLRGIPPQLSTRLDQDAMLDDLVESEQPSALSGWFDGQDGFF